jgi:MFS family permease
MKSTYTTKGFLTWILCVLFFLYEFLLRTITGTYQQSIMQDLHLNSFQFSLISTTSFAVMYGAMQIPVSFIINTIGLKKALLIGTLSCALSLIGFSFSYNYSMALLYRICMGFGASFGFLSLLVSVYEWIPLRYSAICIGVSQFIGTIGPMVAAGPIDSLSQTFEINWRYIFLFLSGVGFFLTILIALFVQNNEKNTNTQIQKPILFRQLFSNIQPWFIAFASAILYISIEVFSENEGRSFLSLKGLRSPSYMITVAWLGYAIGCPFLGCISDLIQRRKIIMIACAVLSIVSMHTVFYSSNKQILFCAFFFLGMSASGQSTSLASIAEQFKKQNAVLGFGLNNGMITVVAVINASLVGLMLDYSKQNSPLPIHTYISAFTTLIVTAFISLIVSTFFIKETYQKSSAPRPI